MMNAAFWLFSLVPLGQAASNPPPAVASPESVRVESVWDFVVKGGPVMIPIGLCSLVAVAVIIERLVSLRRRNVIPLDFFEGLSKLIGDRPIDRQRALAHCQANESPLARILASGIKRLGEPVELLERHIQEAGEREVGMLRKYLRLLSVLGSIAPLLGLLGTITGMITAFQTVATSAEALGRTELLAKGIYEAMITTAAGLMVAIPVVLAYHGLSARIDRVVMEMDRMTVDFVERYVTAPLGAKSRPRQAIAVLDEMPAEPEALESATVAVSAA